MRHAAKTIQFLSPACPWHHDCMYMHRCVLPRMIKGLTCDASCFLRRKLGVTCRTLLLTWPHSKHHGDHQALMHMMVLVRSLCFIPCAIHCKPRAPVCTHLLHHSRTLGILTACTPSTSRQSTQSFTPILTHVSTTNQAANACAARAPRPATGSQCTSLQPAPRLSPS